MTQGRWGLSVISVFALSSSTALAGPHAYTVDPAGSRIVIHVGKTGLLGFSGHEHEILAPVKRGAVIVDPAHVEASSVDVTFDARALRVTDRGESVKDVAKVQETMSGPDCLDTGRFPEIRFVSKAVSARRPTGDGLDVTVRGTLTLHGVSREVDVPVHVDLGGDLDARGTAAIKQTAFAIEPISVAGVVKVKDELQIEVRLVGHRAR